MENSMGESTMETPLSWTVLGAFTLLSAAISFVLALTFLGFGKRGGIPGPKGWPFIGILPDLLRNKDQFHLKLQEWEKEYGKMYKFILLGERWYITSDISAVNKVAHARPASYTRLRKISELAAEMGFLGVFAAEGEMWERHRKITTPAFSSLKVADMQASIALIVERLLRKWDDASSTGQAVDAISDLTKLSVNVVGLTSFGLDINALNASSQVQQDLAFSFQTIERRFLAPFATWRYKYLASTDDRRFEECRRRLGNLILEAIQKHADNQKGQADSPDNLLKRLLEESGKGAKLNDEELVGNILTFFLAGQDTVAITMAWTLYFLAIHPHIQAEVRAEVDLIFGSERDVTLEGLAGINTKELKYLSMVVNEAMRLKPIGPWLEFQPTSSIQVQEGLVLHPKDVIIALTSAMSISEEHFERPLEFDPRRWEGNTRGLGMTPGSPAFGWGQRICPGRFLAFTEMLLCIAAICHRFEFTMAPECPPESVKEISAFVMRPTEVRLSVFRRRN